MNVHPLARGARRFLRAGCLLVAAAVLLFPGAARSAETVHLYLSGSTQGAIQGESSFTSLGRENSIECVLFTHHVGRDQETGRIKLGVVEIRKRIDKSSPKLLRALAAGEEMSLAEFKFFRPNPAGDGTTQQFHTIRLISAQIVDVRRYVPDAIEPASSTLPPLEVVSFTYRGLIDVDVPSGVSVEFP